MSYLYVSPKTWAMSFERRDADEWRVPRWFALVTAPLLGAAFCVFLPLAGFVLLGVALWQRATTRPDAPTSTTPARQVDDYLSHH